MDITTLGAAVAMAKKVMPQVTAADAGKLATVDSNGKWAAAELDVGQGEVAVDSTLLVTGAAADAKVTGDKVAELKSAFNDISIAFGSTPNVIATTAYYISSDGAPHNSTSWDGVVIKLNGESVIKKITAATNTATFLVCAFYNSETVSSGTFISGVAFGKTGESTYEWITIPNNAVVCVIANRKATQETYTYEFLDINNVNAAINGIKTIDVMESDKTVFRRGYILNSDGSYVFQNYWNCITFNCENIDVLTTVKGQANGSSINIVSFYSDNKMEQYISGIAYSNISGDTENTVNNVPIPATAKVCAVTSNSFTSLQIIARLKYAKNDLNDLAQDFADLQLRCVFKYALIDNDFTIIHDELWGSKIVDVDTNASTINIYKIDKGKHGITYYRSINSDFGHFNVVSYNPANDCLLFGNSSNDSGTTGNWFAIVKNPRALGSTVQLENVGTVYSVDVGYKVNAFWGDSNLGEDNIVYLVSNGIGTVTKLMLLKTSGEFNGQYSILDTYSTGESGFIGGGCYWNDKLYIGNGTSMGYRVLNLSTHEFEEVETVFYDGTSELNGSSQGIHIDADFMWRMINKGGTTTNWVLQYYR